MIPLLFSDDLRAFPGERTLVAGRHSYSAHFLANQLGGLGQVTWPLCASVSPLPSHIETATLLLAEGYRKNREKLQQDFDPCAKMYYNVLLLLNNYNFS